MKTSCTYFDVNILNQFLKSTSKAEHCIKLFCCLCLDLVQVILHNFIHVCMATLLIDNVLCKMI